MTESSRSLFLKGLKITRFLLRSSVVLLLQFAGPDLQLLFLQQERETLWQNENLKDIDIDIDISYYHIVFAIAIVKSKTIDNFREI